MNTLRLALLAGCVLASPLTPADVAQAETRTLKVDAQGVKTLRISVAAGDLDVEGAPAQSGSGGQIEVIATIDGDERDVRLTLDKRGDTAELISETEDWSFLWFGLWTRVDLTVRVPHGLTLDIRDGSGDIRLANVTAHTKINDGSGPIVVRSHRGNLDIDDGSGSIDIAGVNGKVQIDDGSGGLVIQNLIGDLDVDDGSGSLDIKNIDGHVTIRDGSGSIEVDTVKRGLTMLSTGSGELRTRNITGDERRR